jgi:hypothetical protein
VILKILIHEKVKCSQRSLAYNLRTKPTTKPKARKTMKKLLYIVLFAFASSVALSSCTEEEVTPATETNSNGGGGSDPLGK